MITAGRGRRGDGGRRGLRAGARSALAAGLLLACATTPTGRRQLAAFPDTEIASMGLAAYDQLKKETPVARDRAATAYVRCVADAITAELREPGIDSIFQSPVHQTYARTAWETTLFEDESANAFALPGGKIGVHTGLLRVAQNRDQLATVLGHEVGHVLARHSNERMSQATGAQLGLMSASAVLGAIGDPASRNHQMVMGALGLGAQAGILLPYGRLQESEADAIGIKLMARAGFDPRQSVELWKNMMRAGGAQPPEFLSTHPSHETRIQGLYDLMPEALAIHQQARGRGRSPGCAPG